MLKSTNQLYNNIFSIFRDPILVVMVCLVDKQQLRPNEVWQLFSRKFTI